MKKTITLFTLIICFATIKAQDLILTNKGDSINCKITKVEPQNVYFTFNKDNQIRSTLINTTDLKEYKFNFYKTTLLPASKVFNNQKYSHWRYGLNLAYGYQTAKSAPNVPQFLRDYNDGLRSGYSFGADVTYFLKENYGIGFKYNRFLTSNRLSNITLTPNSGGPTKYGNMADDISIDFIAPYFSIRQISNNQKNALLMGIALGYIGYQNNAILIDKYTINSSSFGAMLDFGYDVGLSKSTALAFQLSYLASTLSYQDVNDGVKTVRQTFDKNTYIGLGRVEVGVGLKFRSGK
jgi:hypothetical protein